MADTIAMFAPSAAALGRLRALSPLLNAHGFDTKIRDCPWRKNEKAIDEFVHANAVGATLSLVGIMGTQKDAKRASRTIRSLLMLPRHRVGILLDLEGYITWLGEILRDEKYPRKERVVIALHAGTHGSFNGLHTILYGDGFKRMPTIPMPEGIWSDDICNNVARTIRRIVLTDDQSEEIRLSAER